MIQVKENCPFQDPNIDPFEARKEDLRTIIEDQGDAPPNASTPYLIEVGDTFEGMINPDGEWDWIAIELQEGEAVQISMSGQVSGGVPDTVISLFDPGGNLVAFNDDYNLGVYDYSQFTYTADETGIHYIGADTYFLTPEGGNYVIEAIGLDTPPAVISGDPVKALQMATSLDDTSINVYFAESGESGGGIIGNYTSIGFNAYELQQFQAAFDMVEAVTNVSFNIVGNRLSADFVYINSTSFPALGAHEFPDNFGVQYGLFNSDEWDRQGGGDLEVGGFDFVTLTHEILHGVGLAHPHDTGDGSTSIMTGVTGLGSSYTTGAYDLNQGVMTTMSYNTGFETEFGNSFYDATYGMEAGPMALDIAALQDLYGANMSTAGGNDTYTMPESNVSGTYFSAIWDTGGVDEIVYGGSRDTMIDLRAATLRYEEGGGGFVSHADGIEGGFTIAHGVVIENATGGSGADEIFGNDLANILIGGNGNNSMTGGSGADEIFGGKGNDWVSGGDDNDFIRTTRGNDTIFGGDGRDDIRSGIGNDTIYGGEGDDDMAGGRDNDMLYGGDGLNKIVGQAGNDSIYGGQQRDVLNGGGGTDYLEAGDGNDRVKGGGLEDLIYGGAGPDKHYGNNGNDSIFGGSGDDLLNGGGLDDFLDGGTGMDRLKGGAGADSFVFAQGGDRDNIVDFDASEGDRLLINRAFWGASETAADLLAAHASVTERGVELDFGDGDMIVLLGLSTTSGLASAIDEYLGV